MVHDTGGGFTGLEFKKMLNSYVITSKPITVKNPQKSYFVERIHLTMWEIIRMIIFEGHER